MRRSTDRILTTHCGSLPRPADLLDLMKARLSGEPHESGRYDERLRGAVSDIVRQQAERGIDVVSDGEQSKPGFFSYVSERLDGFTPATGEGGFSLFEAEVRDFPEYYEDYFGRAMHGGTVAPVVPVLCTDPVRYRGHVALRHDIDNLKAALRGQRYIEVFMPSVAPSGVGSNRYYQTEEEYLFAVADALHEEYRAIVDAGFLLQVDDPFLTDVYSYSHLGPSERRRTADLYVEAINHGLRDIPPEKVRFHTCYGINEGPRVHDAPLRELMPSLLKIKAGALSFEAANARHEHEYHVFEDVKLPGETVLIPGVITHASNIVEHPELIAERLVRFARLVGRENVVAGTDCGFSSQATYKPEVHSRVMWAKFEAMAEGARLASAQLWPRTRGG
jgi:5-methyltetrahydropteroyltriglutamate--homocysteine methyltransferase